MPGAEQIVTKLRQIEVLQGQGKSVSVACKEAGTTEQTYYPRRSQSRPHSTEMQ
jgi:putative transposase